MSWKKYGEADYITTRWSGGTTTQLAIAPEGAVYADRDFLWRLSSAGVDDDYSKFSGNNSNGNRICQCKRDGFIPSFSNYNRSKYRNNCNRAFGFFRKFKYFIIFMLILFYWCYDYFH